jgi:hypothetical protein
MLTYSVSQLCCFWSMAVSFGVASVTVCMSFGVLPRECQRLNLQDLLERQDDILGCVITGDEIWFYQYDPETKRKSAQWKTANSPWPKKSRQSKSIFETNLQPFLQTEQSTKFTIWKYWKGCMQNFNGNDPNFFPAPCGSCIRTMHLLTWHYEGVVSY